MLKTKIEPIADFISIAVNEMLSPKARQRAVAEFAEDQRDVTLAANRQALGRETPFTQFVDGRQGAPLDSVNPDRGSIVFEFELFTGVLEWIWAELVHRSPIGPVGGAGTYREAHQLFADGREVAIGAVPVAAEYSFTNTVPYARRIEIGRTRTGRDFVISVPNRIYDRVSHEAASRFSNIARISYTFRALAGGRGRAKASLRYPTIVVRPN